MGRGLTRPSSWATDMRRNCRHIFFGRCRPRLNARGTLRLDTHTLHLLLRPEALVNCFEVEGEEPVAQRPETPSPSRHAVGRRLGAGVGAEARHGLERHARRSSWPRPTPRPDPFTLPRNADAAQKQHCTAQWKVHRVWATHARHPGAPRCRHARERLQAGTARTVNTQRQELSRRPTTLVGVTVFLLLEQHSLNTALANRRSQVR